MTGLGAMKRLCRIIAVLMIAGCDLTVYQYLDGQRAYQAGDYDTALFLWRPMAEIGDAAALYSLGTMYAEGKGVARDDAEAVKFFQKAARRGHAKAQVVLGNMYYHGGSVAQDGVQALMWYNIASAGDYEVTQKRDGIAAKMSPDQVGEAQKLTREWLASYGKSAKPPITAKRQ